MTKRPSVWRFSTHSLAAATSPASPTPGPTSAVGEDDSRRDSVLLGAREHRKREVRFAAKCHRRWDMGLLAYDFGIRPLLRQVRLRVDGKVRSLRRCGQRDDDPTVGDLAQRTAVLTLHTNGMRTRLGKRSVIDDQRLKWHALGQVGQGETDRRAAHLVVGPRRSAQKCSRRWWTVSASLGSLAKSVEIDSTLLRRSSDSRPSTYIAKLARWRLSQRCWPSAVRYSERRSLTPSEIGTFMPP